jgi:hypothetical protein
MDLKLRTIASIKRKIELNKFGSVGSLESYSFFNTIRRMKIIERLFNGKEL